MRLREIGREKERERTMIERKKERVRESGEGD